MPIYDYVCGACRHRFEVFHGLNESGPHQCPLCEGPVTRAFAPPTIVFKGTGWAKVDRRSTGAAKTARPAGDAAAAAAPAGETSGATSGTTPTTSPGGGGSAAGPVAD